jgi:hypothetical protein
MEMRPDVGASEAMPAAAAVAEQAAAAAAAATLRLSKMGSSLVDPNDVVANGSSLHAVDSQRGLTFTRSTLTADRNGMSAGRGGDAGSSTLRVVSLDAPLVAVGSVGAQLNLWHSPTKHEDATAAQGVAYNLFNNLW